MEKGALKMKKVYICSPYRGNCYSVTNNVSCARIYCKKAMEQGVIPIAPHIYFTQFLNDDIEEERNLGMEAGLQLLLECSEIWVYGTPTEGMKKEIEYAKEYGIKIVNF